jgi:hypothetical protein
MGVEVRRRKRLKKEDILKGVEKREILYLEDYDAEVEIRPLTDGQLTEIFSLLGSVQLKEDGTPDFSQMNVDKNFLALRQAASLGLVEPELTVEEVAQMKFGIPEFIGTKVLEISGVTSSEEAKKKGEK